MYKFVLYFVAGVIVVMTSLVAFLLITSESTIIQAIVRDFSVLIIIGACLILFTLFLMYNLNLKTKALESEIKKNKEKDGLFIDNLIHHQLELSNSLIIAKDGQKSKDLFLANMSHEIRTPLNGIVGFLSLLKDTEVTKAQAEYIDMCENSSKILLTIINDILDFSKMEAGKLELDRQPNRCKLELRKTAKLFASQIEQKGLNYIIDIDEELPDCLMCDTNRMKQVLINILGNAVKFTSEGEIAFRVKVLSKTDKQATIRYSIKDTGIGIPKEKQALIFEAFSQADKFISGKFGGTGLGISIAKGIVALAGGELMIESDIDKGCEFYFTLTLDICDNVLESNYTSESHYQQNPNEHKILIAEDNQTNQMLIKILLGNRSIEAEIVENGKMAVEEYCNNYNSYDLVFMDIQMPIMNGIDATKEIIKYEKANNLPHTNIVALTANAIKGDRESYFESGMDDYLPKPIDMKSLDRILTKYLHVQKDNESNQHQSLNHEDIDETIEAQEKNMENSTINKVAYDIGEVANEFGIDNKVVLQLLKSFFSNFEEKKEAFYNACKQKDFESIRTISHTFKGSSGSVKFTLIFELTENMEKSAREFNEEFDFIGSFDRLLVLIQEYKDVLNQRKRVDK